MKTAGAGVAYIRAFGGLESPEKTPMGPEGFPLHPEESPVIAGRSRIMTNHGQPFRDQDFGNQPAIRQEKIPQKASVTIPGACSGLEAQDPALNQLPVP